LRNHSKDLVSIDFFIVPTVIFRLIFVFVVLEHERGAVLLPKRLRLRRRDAASCSSTSPAVRRRAGQVITAPRPPWQNPYCERVMGTIRRDCLDPVIVLGEQRRRSILREYPEYDHGSRTHLSLNKDAPEPPAREAIGDGNVITLPMVSGCTLVTPGARLDHSAVRCLALRPKAICALDPASPAASVSERHWQGAWRPDVAHRYSRR
jgi:hypothetical protein